MVSTIKNRRKKEYISNPKVRKKRIYRMNYQIIPIILREKCSHQPDVNTIRHGHFFR